MIRRTRRHSVFRVILYYFVYKRRGDNAEHNTLDGMPYATRPVPLETYRVRLKGVPAHLQPPPIPYQPGSLRPYLHVNKERLRRFVTTYRIYAATTIALVVAAFVNVRFVDTSVLPTNRHTQIDDSLRKQQEFSRSRRNYHGTRSTYLTFHDPRHSRRLIYFHDDASEMYSGEITRLHRERTRLRTQYLNDAPRLSETMAQAMAIQERDEYEVRLRKQENQIARRVGCWAEALPITRENKRRIEELELNSLTSNEAAKINFEDPTLLARVLAEDPHSLSSRELSILWDYYSQDANTLPRFHSWACSFQIYRLALPTIKLPAGLGLYLSPVPVCLMYLLFLRLGHDLRPSFFTRRVLQPSRRLLSKSIVLGRLLFR